MVNTLIRTSAIALLGLVAGATLAADQIPGTARKMVLEKAETGYR